MSKWLDVAITGEIANQSCKIVEINNIPIAIFNLDGEYYAIEDNCPHQHLPLADGLVANNVITCPYHDAKFNLKTGAVVAPPACDALRTFPTRIQGEVIQIEV